jgi:hypothetical protein
MDEVVINIFAIQDHEFYVQMWKDYLVHLFF